MSARVLKSGEAVEFVPFLIPADGDAAYSGKGVNAFVVPEFEGFTFEPEPEPDEPEEIISGEEMIETAEAQAARIIAQAEEQGEIIRQVAVEKAAHESKLAFDAEVAAHVTVLREELTATIDRIASLAASITKDVETELVELAMHIARKIVGHEVLVDRDIALSMVKVSLEKLHNRSIAEVHLNPVDLSYVETHREKLGFRGTLQLVEDNSISPGGCLIHTETGDIDARIDSQFDEIAHGLFS